MDDSRLLELPSRAPRGSHAPDGSPELSVSARILQWLIPDAQWRDRLVLLSCARDANEAQKLVDTYLSRDALAIVPSAEQYLRAGGWGTGTGYFVSDPFLRVLLQHQFEASDAIPTSAQAHAMLRDHYGKAEGTGMLGGCEPSRLYHCLALGEASYVSRRLHESLGESLDASSTREWLTALVEIAAAPCVARPDLRKDTALGKYDAPDLDDIHRSINRLLHAAWYLNDPLVAPDDDVIKKLQLELNNNLAYHHKTGNYLFTQAAEDWPDRLRSWQQDWKPAT